MAILAISAVQIGFEIGSLIWREFHRPRKPTPPLRDLEVSTATSGSPIEFGYGDCRPKGNILWSSGITYFQLGKKSNGGQALGPKGSYVFQASFAAAFGEGPGVIQRIWGDSKLIYDADPTATSDIPPQDYPSWNSTQIYNPGNQVNSGGLVWQALAVNTNSAPSFTNANWEIISAYAPWSSSEQYQAGDTVSRAGQIWVAQLASNNGTTGPEDPLSGATQSVGSENVLYWIQLASLYAPPTIYPGDNNQLPDPLIQASEGMALTPGYRGLIYAVFENFRLTNFANRIPSLRAQVTYTKVASLL